MSRFCTDCGAQRAGESVFCAQCGHKFLDDPAAAQPEAPAALSASAPAPPPAEPAPAAYSPPPTSAYAPAPPAPGTKPSGARRVILIVVGVVVIILGLAQMLKGFGMLSGGSRSSTSSTSTTPSTAFPSSSELNANYIVGTWTARDAVPCANWVKFNADHTLTDNVGVAGTWTLMTTDAASGVLTMTVNNTPTALNVSPQGRDLMAVGTQNWRRTAC